MTLVETSIDHAELRRLNGWTTFGLLALVSFFLVGASVAVQAQSVADLKGKPSARGVAQQSIGSTDASGVPAQGENSPSAGRSAAVARKWEESDFTAESEGGIWPTNTYFQWVFNKEFNLRNTRESESTAFSLIAVANNNNSPSNVVALGANTIIRSNEGVGFGANFIVRTESGLVRPKMIGLEVDIEPAEGVVPGADSIAIPINAFNSPNPGAAIQTGGINGGSFANGIVFYGIASTGAGVAAGSHAKMNALVNSSGCDCDNAAIVHGTGLSQGDAYGIKGKGKSPYIYGDEANNLVIRLGSAGSVKIYSSDGETTLFDIGPEGIVTINGRRAVSCSGPPSKLFRVDNGIVTHC